MYDVTKLVTKQVFVDLVTILPSPRQKKTGRKRCSKKALVNGILQVLGNGVSWNNIAKCGASPTSCWRYFREIQRRGLLKVIFKALVKEQTDVTEGAIDTNSTTSFRFKRLTGWDGKHKKIATKISLFTDKEGLPVDVILGKGNKHDLTFVENHVQNTKGRRRKFLNLDMIYASVKLRRKLRKKGIKINMQTREGYHIRKRGPKFQFDGEKYKVRFKIERTHAWMENFKRLRLRREYLPAMFKGFVYLALIIILLRS